MNEEQLLKSFQFPKSTFVLRTFPYNKLEPHLSSAQKKVVSEYVIPRGIRLLAIISPKNTNIQKYEDENERFEEIHFYCIQLNNLNKAIDVYKIFAHVIPYPLVILFTSGEKSKWVMATHHKQRNTHLLTMEKIYEIDDFLSHDQIEGRLSFEKMNHMNLKTTYRSWIEQLLQIELQMNYALQKNITLEDNVLEKLKDLDRQIEQLVKQAKREKQMNKRIEIQLKVTKLKNEKKELMANSEIKEE